MHTCLALPSTTVPVYMATPGERIGSRQTGAALQVWLFKVILAQKSLQPWPSGELLMTNVHTTHGQGRFKQYGYIRLHLSQKYPGHKISVSPPHHALGNKYIQSTSVLPKATWTHKIIWHWEGCVFTPKLKSDSILIMDKQAHRFVYLGVCSSSSCIVSILKYFDCHTLTQGMCSLSHECVDTTQEN